MHSESYRIIPDRHNFLSFLQTLELSPELYQENPA